MDALLSVSFREGFITPPPPGLSALDVKQELGHWKPVGRHEAYHRTDAAVGGLPWFRILIEEFQQPELVVEQRPDFCEPGRWPDLGVEPGEIPARYHELGEKLVVAEELPYALGVTHGPILPSAPPTAHRCL